MPVEHDGKTYILTLLFASLSFVENDCQSVNH